LLILGQYYGIEINMWSSALSGGTKHGYVVNGTMHALPVISS